MVKLNNSKPVLTIKLDSRQAECLDMSRESFIHYFKFKKTTCVLNFLKMKLIFILIIVLAVCDAGN